MGVTWWVDTTPVASSKVAPRRRFAIAMTCPPTGPAPETPYLVTRFNRRALSYGADAWALMDGSWDGAGQGCGMVQSGLGVHTGVAHQHLGGL